MKIGAALSSIILLAAPFAQGAIFEPVTAFRGGPGYPTRGTTLQHYTDGYDYGTTDFDGPSRDGTIYRVSPQGGVEMLVAGSFQNGRGDLIGLTPDGLGFFWSVS